MTMAGHDPDLQVRTFGAAQFFSNSPCDPALDALGGPVRGVNRARAADQ